MQYRPYWSLEIQYPTTSDLGIMILRILVGGLISGLVHIIVKISSMKVASMLFPDDRKIKYTDSRMISKVTLIQYIINTFYKVRETVMYK